MIPYYDQDGITIYHGDCREVLPTLDIVDHVITDPPYSEATHRGARTGCLGELPLVDFDAINQPDLSSILADLTFVTRRWVVATMDWNHIAAIAAEPPAGLRFVRFGIWVKPNGAPQFTGDRPGQGWEGIAILHRKGGHLRWNGGGRTSVFTYPKVETVHPTGKPEKLLRQLVQLFTDVGDTILDPFMGSGTTLRAAKDLGRKAIGIEIEERYCEIAAKRLQQSVLPLEMAR